MLWEMTVGEEPPPPPLPPRKRLEGTPQQEAFWDELRHGTANLVLEARAGTGKSTSCREGMWRLLEADRNLAIRYCCFNTKVAQEFGAKAPPGVEVGTMHRFGLEALRAAFRSNPEKNKTYFVLDECGGRDLKRYVRKSISMLVGLAKNHMVIPGDDLSDDFGTLWELVNRFDIQTYRQPDHIIGLAWECLRRSVEITNIVDFDDMLWLCVVHGVPFPNVDFLFIDEAQDLNGTQHAMAEQMSGSGRTVVVGDPYQSIYAFRGADSQSMERLKAKLDAKTLPLTVTFRCPRSHVERARELVPDFEAAPEAPEGEWDDAPDQAAVEDALPGDLILCRANARLVSACLKAIGSRKPATVRGRNFADSLLSIIARLNDPGTVATFLRNLDAWKAREIVQLSERDGTDDLIEQVQDRAACLEAVAKSCDSPAEIPTVLNRLFSDDDAGRMVTFSSVHRAKGSEARRVTYIDVPYSAKRDKDRPPQPWELQQRRNLRYVALTRSLHSMTVCPPNPKTDSLKPQTTRVSGGTTTLFGEESDS